MGEGQSTSSSNTVDPPCEPQETGEQQEAEQREQALLILIEDLERELARYRRELFELRLGANLPAAHVHIVLFSVGEELIALPHDVVREVVVLAQLMPLPEAPVWVAGALDLHGTLIPVIDMDMKLLGQTRGRTLSDRIMICRSGEQLVGLLVEHVTGVVPWSPLPLRRPTADVPYARYVQGTLEVEGRSTLLIDLDALLGSAALPEGHP